MWRIELIDGGVEIDAEPLSKFCPYFEALIDTLMREQRERTVRMEFTLEEMSEYLRMTVEQVREDVFREKTIDDVFGRGPARPNVDPFLMFQVADYVGDKETRGWCVQQFQEMLGSFQQLCGSSFLNSVPYNFEVVVKQLSQLIKLGGKVSLLDHGVDVRQSLVTNVTLSSVDIRDLFDTSMQRTSRLSYARALLRGIALVDSSIIELLVVECEKLPWGYITGAHSNIYQSTALSLDGCGLSNQKLCLLLELHGKELWDSNRSIISREFLFRLATDVQAHRESSQSLLNFCAVVDGGFHQIIHLLLRQDPPLDVTPFKPCVQLAIEQRRHGVLNYFSQFPELGGAWLQSVAVPSEWCPSEKMIVLLLKQGGDPFLKRTPFKNNTAHAKQLNMSLAQFADFLREHGGACLNDRKAVYDIAVSSGHTVVLNYVDGRECAVQ